MQQIRKKLRWTRLLLTRQIVKYIAPSPVNQTRQFENNCFIELIENINAYDSWLKYEEITSLSKGKRQITMQGKIRFLPLLKNTMDTQQNATAWRGRKWWWQWPTLISDQSAYMNCKVDVVDFHYYFYSYRNNQIKLRFIYQVFDVDV